MLQILLIESDYTLDIALCYRPTAVHPSPPALCRALQASSIPPCLVLSERQNSPMLNDARSPLIVENQGVARATPGPLPFPWWSKSAVKCHPRVHNGCQTRRVAEERQTMGLQCCAR